MNLHSVIMQATFGVFLVEISYVKYYLVVYGCLIQCWRCSHCEVWKPWQN